MKYFLGLSAFVVLSTSVRSLPGQALRAAAQGRCTFQAAQPFSGSTFFSALAQPSYLYFNHRNHKVFLGAMPVNFDQYHEISNYCKANNVALVAVSKVKPETDILEMYKLGQLDFGENYVQELVAKCEALPKDIRWHYIGHLQSNKVKYIAPFVHLVQGVDSEKLLKEINKQALKTNRVINCLLQMHIAKEETKFGLNEEELKTVLDNLDSLQNIKVCGLMGMASFSDDQDLVRSEMQYLKTLYDRYGSLKTSNRDFSILSMGMSGDYKIAIENGSNMVRIGSLLFGARKAGE